MALHRGTDGQGDDSDRVRLRVNEATAKGGQAYSRYGSDTHKQVYVYGRLDMSKTVLGSNFGNRARCFNKGGIF